MTWEVYHWARFLADGTTYFKILAYDPVTKAREMEYCYTAPRAEHRSIKAAKILARSRKTQVIYIRNKRRDYPLGVD